MKVYSLIFIATLLVLSCNTSSHISKIGKESLDHFPGVEYSEIYVYQHNSLEKSINLTRSDNMKLVTDLWVPKSLTNSSIEDFKSNGWVLKKQLTKQEIRRLRKIFVDQGREYVLSTYAKSGYSTSLIFTSEDQKIVGVIYFCTDGLSIEARPALAPNKGKNFFWNKEGVDEFREYLIKLELVNSDN